MEQVKKSNTQEKNDVPGNKLAQKLRNFKKPDDPKQQQQQPGGTGHNNNSNEDPHQHRSLREFVSFMMHHGDHDPDLSENGKAIHRALRRRFLLNPYRPLWGLGRGTVTALYVTPKQSFDRSKLGEFSHTEKEEKMPEEGEAHLPTVNFELEPNHSDWIAEKMAAIIASTESYCDVLSLGPPEGAFLDQFRAALLHLHAKNKTIFIRILFGDILGYPLVVEKVVKDLTANWDDDTKATTKLQIWVGSWQKDFSWNHSKIIASDGERLLTGGHNMYNRHYLRENPIHDVSIEVKGDITLQSHLYANEQWKHVRKGVGFHIAECCGPANVTRKVQSVPFPASKNQFDYPPLFEKEKHYKPSKLTAADILNKWRKTEVPMISIGRLGTLTRFRIRPSDDALFVMLDSAKKTIRLALQDIGPVCIPGTKFPLPGTHWPNKLLRILGDALWRDVKIEIIVSNPFSYPDHLEQMDANYGNGWSCEDVAVHIAWRMFRKRRRLCYANVDLNIQEKVAKNLKISYLRGVQGRHWPDGMGLSLHSKHYIVDDTVCYIGSQNLYICDLAEWGIIIDSETQTKQLMEEFWTPVWELSYKEADCDMNKVIQRL